MRYFRVVLNYSPPFGEIEFRRTPSNSKLRNKTLDFNWSSNEFIPLEILSAQFSLTDESDYLDFLKVSHLRWQGFLFNERGEKRLSPFNLQENRINALKIYKSPKGDEYKDYTLIQFNSLAQNSIKRVRYVRVMRRTGEQEDFNVDYPIFLKNEINIPFNDRILRKIEVLEIEFFTSKNNEGWLDLISNSFLFGDDFVVSERLLDNLKGLTGFCTEVGPLIC